MPEANRPAREHQAYGRSDKRDRQRNDDDSVFEKDGIAVVIDDVSLGLLNGAEVDFVEDLMGASFQIKNPNAASSCGCGNSFSVG